MKNWLFLLSFLMIFSACRDDEFDAPPTDFTDPGLTVTHTIAELKASHILGEYNQIDEDMILSGIIVADDASGNFYQRLVIDDGTAGIEVGIRANDLFNLYPMGRRIYVKAKDLWIGDYNGVVQLGGSVEQDGNFQRINGIEEILISQYIVGGALEGQPAPLELSINEINTSHISRLVKISNAEFAPGSRNTSYADAVSDPPQSVNHIVQDCNGGSVIMRTSGYCNFATSITPSGNGSVTAIYSVFGTDRQLFIRDTTDVDMPGATCNQSIETKDISEIRALFTSSEINAPSVVIEGIVISDRANGNFNGQNAVIQQEGEKGIVLRFTSEHNLDLGMKVRADLSGGSISEFNGLLQVGNLNTAQTEIVSSGNSITPADVSVDDVLSNFAEYESTLVKFENVNLTGGTWGDGVTLSDGTASISVFTFFSASFSGLSVPATANSIVAIVGEFNSPQLNLRNAMDIDGETTGGGDPELASVAMIQDLWSGSATTISSNYFIEGVVISDYASLNITGRNLVLQDGDRGIVIRFADEHAFPLGANLRVTVANQELSDFNGLLQVNNVPNANATDIGSSMTVTPNVVTIAEILAAPDDLESTLVQIVDATISGSSTFDGNTTVTDASGSIPMYTRADATVASVSVPSGAVQLTAIVGDFNEVQLNLRNENDID